MGAFLRMYAFLSQIFDYGSTAIEKRAIFYRALLPLLEFGREPSGDRPLQGATHPPHHPQ
jgi:type I restriction enzyme R subunit